jgi:predicted nucleotide-binding protein (sugar kinase/HSP70/actin superfamily)
MFIGGPSLNKAVVAAFEIVLGRRLIVPLHREVLGAYGAAVLLHEKIKAVSNNPKICRDLECVINDRLNYNEKVCRADSNCHNQCKLKIYDFGNRRSIWGGECGRYELTRRAIQKRKNYFKLRQMLWEQHLDGAYDVLGAEPLMEVDGRPTVGMQRALYGHQTGILWAHFFDYLGYRLVFTKSTNAHISKCGIEHAEDGVCFPVKVSHGHIRELAGKTRYLFIPSLLNMPTPNASETGRFCPMVMSNGYMVRMALNLNKSAILNPALHLKNSPEALAEEITRQMKSRLGHGKALFKEALYHALEKQRNFENDLRQNGEKILAERNEDEPLIVVTGRPYNLYDERLNLWLGRNLSRIGMDALPMDFIDVSSMDLSDFSSMYWGLGAQILRAARWINMAPHVFGLHLTNFGCGADSFLEHFYKHIMGQKAYLILELDEHSSMAGVMTRLEAFKNVIENSMIEKVACRSMAV